MAYITYMQYVNLYGDSPVCEAEFPLYASLASDVIDSVTGYRIPQGGGFPALPLLVQELVKKAAAAQVLYFTQIGLETVLTGQTGQSFTVGKVSVSGGALAGGGAGPTALLLCPMAAVLLEQTPLMGRGVPVCSDRFLNPFWGI